MYYPTQISNFSKPNLMGGVRSGKEKPENCYYIWNRHNKTPSKKYDVVVEIGPGDTIGAGIFALLYGANKYYVVDAVHHKRSVEQDLLMLDDIIKFLKQKQNLEKDFTIDFSRVEKIKEAIRVSRINPTLIEFIVPLNKEKIPANSVDLIFSHAVLEHVDNIEELCLAQSYWLKKGGITSHQIDLKSHGVHRLWDGHRYYNKFVWWLIRGNYPYFINRLTFKDHKKLLEKYIGETLKTEFVKKESHYGGENISSAYIQNIKN